MDYSNIAHVHPLTRTERKCLEFIASGYADAEIGKELILAPNEVKTVISVAMIKLGTKNRMSAVARATRLGILDLENQTRDA